MNTLIPFYSLKSIIHLRNTSYFLLNYKHIKIKSLLSNHFLYKMNTRNYNISEKKIPY